MHIGSIPGYLRGIAETLEDGEWYEGDVVVHNHPYYGVEPHARPRHRRAGVPPAAASSASPPTPRTTSTSARRRPASSSTCPTSSPKACCFAGTKLYRKGEPQPRRCGTSSAATAAPRGQLVRPTSRRRSPRRGSARSASWSCIDKYGEDTVFGAANQLMDYSERLMRQRIAEIPDGDYVAEGWLDDDGRNRDQRLKVKVTVRVQGDGVEVDLTGSADQTPTAYNVPFEGSTKVAAYCAFRKLLLDAVTSDVRAPSNEGSFRPVKVTAPLGSIFNPKAPASAEARFTQCNRMIDLIIKALAPVLPERVIAGSSASISFAAYSGVRPSRRLLGVPRGQRGRLWRPAALRRARHRSTT